MWSIFVAIFGGVYWGSKLHKERSEIKKADAEIANMRAIQDAWYSRVRDSIMEGRTRYKANTPEFIKHRDEALALIHTFPGLENAQFDLSRRRNNGYYAIKMIQYIQMVKHGKLPATYSNHISTLLDLAINTRPSKKARIEFCKWIESSLQSSGVNSARLYYTQQDYATFVWEPFVYHWDKAIRVDDPTLESRMLGL